MGSKLSKAKQSSVYQIWMKEESDLVQAVSRAFGEFIILEQFLKTIEKASDKGVKDVLNILLALFVWNKIERDLSWYLLAGIIESQDGQKVRQYIKTLCIKIKPDCLHLVDTFGIPDHILQAPIGMNWEKYNTTNNKGELTRSLSNSIANQ